MLTYKVCLDLVEHLGSGMPRILQAYPKSCFRFTDNFIRMSFPTSGKTNATQKVSGKSEVKTPEKLIEFFRKNPNKTLQDAAEALGKSISSMEKVSAQLRKGSPKGVYPSFHAFTTRD